MQNQKNSLEISCYVLGAGAFGVFLRWLQDQMAFDDAGLAERSVFHFIVPLFILASAYVFIRFVDNFRAKRFFLPEDFCGALHNEGKSFTFFRWAIGVVMCLGALLVLFTCEVEKFPGLLRIIAVLGILTGISYPLLLSAANQKNIHPAFLCTLSIMPVLLFSFWLVACYKMNDINSVVWSFGIEIVSIIITILAFFRMAGFAFGTPKSGHCMFYAMMGCAMCVMTVADTRNIGLQVMFFSAALMLLFYNWIMVKNLVQRKAQREEPLEDGFDRL